MELKNISFPPKIFEESAKFNSRILNDILRGVHKIFIMTLIYHRSGYETWIWNSVLRRMSDNVFPYKFVAMGYTK